MTITATMTQSLNLRLIGLCDNITVIENSDLLDINSIEDGVLTVYAAWSGAAVTSCNKTILALYEQNYNGQIIVVNTDCMTPHFQIKTFGQVCHGWGEIFIIGKGKIIKKYLGTDSFSNFQAESDKQKKI